MNQVAIEKTGAEIQWSTVCTTDDLVPNSGVCALVNGQQVALFYLPSTDEKVFAIGNYDPIGKANVLSRGMVGDLKDCLVVASPLYKQHFSLRDGQCLEDEEVSVASYPARIDGKAVQVGV